MWLKISFSTALMAVVFLFAGSVVQEAQREAGHLDAYDELWQGTSYAARSDGFSGLDPSQKTQLFRTHLSRCLEQHRSELSPQQIALVNRVERLLDADYYRLRPSLETVRIQVALETEVESLFEADDGRFFTLRGPWCASVQVT